MSYTGLTDSEVNESRKAYGKNELIRKERGVWGIVKEVLFEPMMLLLFLACSLYFVNGKPHEGSIMIVALLVIATISLIQSYRTERAMIALRKLSQPHTHVIRNGKKGSIPSDEVVVGDIMIVSEGEQVTADAEIVQFNDLSVDEAILTGESFPVAKDAENSILYTGTTITSGLAHAKVIAVGNSTRIGKLGISIERTARGKTPLERQVQGFIRGMTAIGFAAFALVTIINALKADSWMTGLMEGLTLAMAIIPEEIPVALTTFMALGAYRMMKSNVLVKQPQTVEALGAATVICVDKTGTITENRMKVVELFDATTGQVIKIDKDGSKAEDILFIARLASEPIPFDPMEKAIVEQFEILNLSVESNKMIHEYPLSGHPPMMTHVYKDGSGKRTIACKGAPEGVIKNSLLHDSDKAKIRKIQEEMAAPGNRVLAIAVAEYGEEKLPQSQEEFRWKLLGLLALNDPPKKNIPEVVKSFHEAGIGVKMITGDYPITACGIAKQVGITKPGNFITGEEINMASELQLDKMVEEVNVFARVQPEMKLRIIEALKANNEVVAMTGDGVNDGPALKAAHIGIAMGEKGSETARQAASLILVDGDLGSMVTAVAFGRKIYSNLKKAIQYIITIHVPILSVVIVPLLLGWKYATLLKPVHMIFLELVMGPTCSIIYANEPMEHILMKQRPRKFSTTFFSWRELSISLLQGAVVACGSLGVLQYCIQANINIDSTRTIVFALIIFSNIMLTAVGRSKIYNVFRTFRYKNKLLPLAIILQLIFLFMFIYIEPLRNVFYFTVIPAKFYVLCTLVAIVSVAWIELFKREGKIGER